MAEAPVIFSDLLRRLRAGARLTQEELASAANLSRRTVSDLERGVANTPQKETVRLLADALDLLGPERAQFEAVARGRPGQRVSAATAAAAMRSLPRDVASFIGRQRELELLAETAAGAAGVGSIHVIGGMAGVGKTAFAVHAGYRLADRFSDGQIFVLLHGHTPGRRPTDPADALVGMMLTIGVPAAQIPSGLEARMALWRDRVGGKRLLLVLDDAASSQQVLPLLPGRGSSLVLVTSRRHLYALDEATAISLDILPPAEAAELLTHLAGRAGLRPDDQAVAQITRLCGYLPLAIGMVAGQLRHHPAWSVARRAAELAAAVDRVGLMATENVSVGAAFDLSYANLTPGQQRLFRRLGLHPGADIDGYAAAALDGADLATACGGLEALYDHYLLTEPTQGRYRLHDLIREHASALAARDDSRGDRDRATARLLDYYQHAAARAGALIARSTRPAPATAADAVPAEVPALSDFEQALAWARAERASLVACLDHASTAGQQVRVITLTAGIAGLLRRDGPWAEAITRHTTAAEAARRLGDRLGQASALTDLGEVHCMTGDYSAAALALGQALGLYRDLGHRLGEANDLSCLGLVRYMTGDYRAAAQALEQALGLYRDVGDQRGEANALHHVGIVRWLTGDYPAAALALEHALDLYRYLGDRAGQANTLLQLGGLQYTTDDYRAAAAALKQALGLYRGFGDRAGQANALTYLGQVRRMTGDFRAAIRAQEQALDIDRDLGSRLGQASAIHELGIVRRLTGDFPAAIQAQEQALGTYLDLGIRTGQASALHQLGIVRRLTGDYPAAAHALDQALGIYRILGERGGEAAALNETGTLHRVRDELAEAEGCHRGALKLARSIASSWNEAHAVAGLGRCALAAGHATQAKHLLRQALEIFQRIGAADATDLQAELDVLTGRAAVG